MKPALLAFLVVLSASACRTQLLPNTDVEDTPRNRDIVAFCEQYRHAVEDKDVSALIAMAHPDYYEDGGNTDASDDIDRTGLQQYLTERFVQSKAIRYEIRYRRVTPGRDGEVLVDYTYSASYQLPTDEGDKWQRAVAENRLQLVPKGEAFLIKAGM